MRGPTGATWQRPGGEQGLLLRGPLFPTMKAAPPPSFGTFGQIRRQGIPFHVAANRVEVVIILDGKRLEPTLIDVSTAAAVAVSMPTLGVRQRQPTRASRQLAIFPRPNH